MQRAGSDGMCGRVALVGAECEESLPLRYLYGSLRQAGYNVVLLAFNQEADLEQVARDLADSAAPLAGFSMVFTARADQFARLARRARELGYAGHLVAGGHFAAFNAEVLLRDEPAFDSVAIGEGERLIVDLAAHLEALEVVRGLVWRRADGVIVCNPPAVPVDNLDTLPTPVRMTPPDRYLGLPIANMLSSRGCTHACHFCSIAAWHRLCGGQHYRARSAENVADEMAALYADGYRLFNFHDDNFLPGTVTQNMARIEALGRALDRRRIGQIGFAIKCRPSAVHPAVFGRLRGRGLFRVFLGIEAGTEASLENLGRRQTVAQNERALEVLNGLDLHVCFNLLLFNPDSTLEDFRANVAFMQAHPANPMNFCRTEVYSGTPLAAHLQAADRLAGSYWGYGYRIRDARAQRAFELMHRVLFDRHHSDENVHHLTMRVDYERQLLADFFQCPSELHVRAKTFIRGVNLASAEFLMRIAELATTGTEPAAEQLDALRRDLTQDTRRREQESAEILTAIRQTAWLESQPGSLSLARIGVAASLLFAAGTSAMGQHMSERIAVPLEQPVTPPATNPAVKPAEGSATNAPAQPGQPPDGDFSRLSAYMIPLTRIIARHMDQAQDVDLEFRLDQESKVTFAAVYKAGRAKDAVGGALSKDAKAKAEKLLGKLGADTFAVREKATQELQTLGPAVLPLLQAHQAGQSDPEVTLRCGQIIAALDYCAAVRDYDGMIQEIKELNMPLGANDRNKRYLGTIPASALERWIRRDRGGGVPHIAEMAPAPLD